MKRTHFTTLALCLALVACDDAAEGPGSDAPYDDDLQTDNGEASELEGDGGEGDGGTSGAGSSTGNRRDAGGTRDAGPRGDEETRDAAAPTTTDASVVTDAATPSTPPSSGDIIPAGEHCAAVANFDAQATAFEDEVLKLTNEARAVGYNCDEKGMFGPTTPLKMQAQLRCSSRLHSKYMADSGQFAHEAPTGSTPFTRMMAAGYKFSTAGENIAAGQSTPKAVVDGWLKSDGHCANIMSPNYTEIGVGYVAVAGKPAAGRYGSYWTQNFGKPRK